METINIHCNFDVLVDPSSLVEHPKNRNVHPKEQIKRLSKLLKYYGWRHPIIVDADDRKTIIVGRGRQMSALQMKLKEVPIVYQKFENEDQKYSFIQADNAISEWSELDLSAINSDLADLDPSFDIDLLGLKDFTIEPADKYADVDLDETPALPTEPISKLGDLYQLGNHRLLCGDSTDILQVERLMNGEKADMVFTDPPYGVKVVKSGMVGADFGVAKKGKYKEILSDETTDCAKSFYHTCIAFGFDKFIIWGGNYFTDFLEPKNSWVVWNKRATTEIKNTFADAELAWSNIGFPVRLHNQLWNGFIRTGEKEKRVHPTQKPINLAKFCFDLLVDCKSVFDGFAGSGSTLIACETTNRKCYTMELDPHYCDVIINRWQNLTGQKAVLLNG